MNEREAYIALNIMEKVGPVGVRSLVEKLGSAYAIFDADKIALKSVKGIGPETVEAIISQRESVDWQGEIDRAQNAGARIITRIDPEYPPRLLEIHDPPMALYVKGSIESRDKQGIGIVGTRHPTHYGMETAEKMAYGLSKTGFTVISGLALGIDTAAHKGALKANGRTIAVIGSGLSRIYPESNKVLAEHISANGAVISEFSMCREPDKTTFPIRNRIVSGLSRAVVVIEAGLKSGAIITANQALEQGRSVMAVPGRVDSPASKGCHDLIKNGARLVESVDDIIEEFEFLVPRSAEAREPRPRPSVSKEEELLLKCLDSGELDMDNLIRESGLSASAVSSLLIGLEMKKLVQMRPGRVVEMLR